MKLRGSFEAMMLKKNIIPKSIGIVKQCLMYIARFIKIRCTYIPRQFCIQREVLGQYLALLFVALCNYGAISLELSSWICRDTRLQSVQLSVYQSKTLFQMFCLAISKSFYLVFMKKKKAFLLCQSYRSQRHCG